MSKNPIRGVAERGGFDQIWELCLGVPFGMIRRPRAPGSQRSQGASGALFKQFSHTIYHTQGDAVTLMQSNTLLRQWHVLVNTIPTEAEYRRETGATKPSDDTMQAFLEMKTWPMDGRLPI